MADTLKLTDNEASAEHSGALQLTPDPLIGREVGGYIVEKPLGEGGMGLVFLARHPILNRHFAIKVLRPEAAADEHISVNFEREAQTLSSLKHPHIIDIVGFGTLEDGRQYMVMEFVKGQTLQDELERDGKLELQRALKLADQILDGLDAAHSVGVIHRDLKPGNVLIARVSGGTEVLKLLDFGLAKQQPESLVGLSIDSKAGASVIAGTPEYIAPEQAQGKHAGKHSDLYSFGIVFCEILTGVQPFVVPDDDPDRIRTLLKMHISSPAPLISALSPERYFPAELEELVADLLKKDPSERPSSASTVRARLQKVQRTLAKEATHMEPNPLLEFSAPTQGVVVSRSLALEGQAQRRPSRLGIAFAVAAVLLLGFGIRLLTQAEPPQTLALPAQVPMGQIAEPEQPAPWPPPAPVPVVAAAVVPAEPEEVVALPPPVAPPRRLTATIASPTPVVQISKSGCEPTDRWRTSARAHLEESPADAERELTVTARR